MATQEEWGKFYPKKVIQIGGVELSTEIGLVKIFIQKSNPKKSYPKTYLTYLMLLYTQKQLSYTIIVLTN